MAQVSHVCWLTVQSADQITLRHAGKEYDSIITQGARAQQIVERLDRLAKDYPLVCEQQDLILLGESLFDLLFGSEATQVFRTDTGERTEAPLNKPLGEVFLSLAAQHRKEHRGPSQHHGEPAVWRGCRPLGQPAMGVPLRPSAEMGKGSSWPARIHRSST